MSSQDVVIHVRLIPIAATILIAAMAVQPIALAEDGTSKTGTASGSIILTEPVSGDWLGTFGASACQAHTPFLPGYCNSASLVGGGIWDIRHLNSATSTKTIIYGEFTTDVISCAPCGLLNISLGNDRDDDGLVTNVDALNDDIGHNHGTHSGFDDQWAHDQFAGSVSVGDSMTIQFCFAHDADAAGHDWDDLIGFTRTNLLEPTVGSLLVSLSSLTLTENGMNACPSGYRANLHEGNNPPPSIEGYYRIDAPGIPPLPSVACSPSVYSWAITSGSSSNFNRNGCDRFTWQIDDGPATLKFYTSGGTHLSGNDITGSTGSRNIGSWPSSANYAQVHSSSSSSGTFVTHY